MKLSVEQLFKLLSEAYKFVSGVRKKKSNEPVKADKSVRSALDDWGSFTDDPLHRPKPEKRGK